MKITNMAITSPVFMASIYYQGKGWKMKISRFYKESEGAFSGQNTNIKKIVERQGLFRISAV